MSIHMCCSLLYGQHITLIGGDFPGYALYQGASDKKPRPTRVMSKQLLCNASQDTVWLTVVGVASHHPEDSSKPDMVICFHEHRSQMRCFKGDHLYQWTLIAPPKSGVWL